MSIPSGTSLTVANAGFTTTANAVSGAGTLTVQSSTTTLHIFNAAGVSGITGLTVQNANIVTSFNNLFTVAGPCTSSVSGVSSNTFQTQGTGTMSCNSITTNSGTLILQTGSTSIAIGGAVN